MVFVEALFVQQDAGDVTEAVTSSLALVAQAAQRHFEHHIAERLGAIFALGEEQAVATRQLFQLLQDGQRLGGQWHQVLAAFLHPLGWYRPHDAFQIKLAPVSLAHFAGAHAVDDQQAQAELHRPCATVGRHGAQQLLQTFLADVGIVLGLLAL